MRAQHTGGKVRGAKERWKLFRVAKNDKILEKKENNFVDIS